MEYKDSIYDTNLKIYIIKNNTNLNLFKYNV